MSITKRFLITDFYLKITE